MATKGCNKLPTIYDLNKSLQDIIEEVNKKNICLFDILPIAKPDLLVPLVEELLNYYDCEKSLFNINGHKLVITLEDILYLTGLPIRGTPIMIASKDTKAFKRVFGIVKNKPGNIKDLKDLAGNKNVDTDTRVKATLMVLIACFVMPAGNRYHIKGDFVKFVERLEDVDNYAWGAALLAFLSNGIRKWNDPTWKVNEKKSELDGNLWVVLAFFLIRIPDLRAAIKIDLNLDRQQVPLLLPVVEAVDKISHNHQPTYLTKVREILNNLTKDKIILKPYALDLQRPILRAQKMYKLLLAPICCMGVVHYHTPHYAHKQFEELEEVDVNQIMWQPPKDMKRKENRGLTAQKFLSGVELQLWNEGRLVFNYLPGHEDDGMFDQPERHVENVIDDQPERHVDNVIVDQLETSDSDQPETSYPRDVDSLVHVDRPETPMHADTKSEPHRESSVLSRRSLLGSAGMTPLTAEECHTARAKKMLVQGVTHPTPRQDELVAMVVASVGGEGDEEPAESKTVVYNPLDFPAGDWHSELVVGKYRTENPSMWDAEYPFGKCLEQASCAEDKEKMQKLGIMQSPDDMRYFPQGTSVVANSTEELWSERRERYHMRMQSLKEKIKELNNRLGKLVTHTEFDLKTSAQRCRNLEKAKSELQSTLASVLEERDHLKTRITGLGG